MASAAVIEAIKRRLAVCDSITARAAQGKTTLLAADRKVLEATAPTLRGLDMSILLGGLGSGTPAPNVPNPPADTLGPTTPRGLRVISKNQTSITLGWLPACDPVRPLSSEPADGLASHKVYNAATDALLQTVACADGLTPTFTATNIGSVLPGTFAVTPSGVDVTLISDGLGFIAGSDSGAAYLADVDYDAGFTLSARIGSIASGFGDAQVGIMLRKDTTPGSPMVFLLLRQSGNQTQINVRPQQNDSVIPIVVGNIPAPCHLFAVVAGGQVGIYYSVDGNSPSLFQTVECPITGMGKAGAAAASKLALTSVTGIVQSLCVQSLAEQTVTISSLTSNTSYGFKVTAVDDAGNESAASATLTVSTDSGTLAAYAAQTGAASKYHQGGLPNSAPYDLADSFGTDMQFFWVEELDMGGTATTWPAMGTGHYRGDLRGWRDLGGKAIALPITTGRTATFGQLNVNLPDHHFNGATARALGAIFELGQSSRLNPNGLRQTYKHGSSAWGNADASGLANGDGMGFFSGAGNIVVQYWDYRWTTDEFLDFTEKSRSEWVAITNCLFMEALANSGRGERHDYGPIIGYGGRNVALNRNLFLHGSFRFPMLIKGLNAFNADNLMYDTEAQQEIFGNDDGGDVIAQLDSGWWIGGPHTTAGMKPIQGAGNIGSAAALTANSRACLSDLRVYDPLNRIGDYDQSNPANHRTNLGTVPASFWTTTRQTAAEITNYNRTVAPLNGSNRVDKATALALATLAAANCGCSPGAPYAGSPSASARLRPQRFINQTGSGYGFPPDSQSQVGGFASIPVTTLADPSASGAFGGNPFPKANPFGIGGNGRANWLNWLELVERTYCGTPANA